MDNPAADQTLLQARQARLHLAGAQERLIAFIEEASEVTWVELISGDGWPAAVVAYHCAMGHERALGWIESALHGTPVTQSQADLDQLNAIDARERAGVSPEQCLELARRTYGALHPALDSLTAEDLLRRVAFGPAGGAEVSVIDLIEAASHHLEEHLARAQSALGHV